MAFLQTIISNHNFVLVQSSIAQSGLPLLRRLIDLYASQNNVLLVCLQTSPTSLLDGVAHSSNVTALDLTGNIPEYSSDYVDPQNSILSKLDKFATTTTIILDSVHTLLLDMGSLSKTCLFLKSLQKKSANLVLHVLGPNELISRLKPTSFSPSLVHFNAHPSALITQISTEYLTSPPPASKPDKFWNIFQPLSERIEDTEKIVYSVTGKGSGDLAEFVVEVTVRHAGPSSRKRTLERDLHGFSALAGGICDITTLDNLKSVFRTGAAIEQETESQIHTTSFNLKLTDSQQEARASVPLPYAHEGQAGAAAIYYDYDSADDHDEDDPDEDLEI